MSTTTAKKPAVKLLDAKEIEVGDVFSEVSHYTFLGTDGGDYKLSHHASGTNVTLTGAYIEKFLSTANQHHKEVEVTREDTYWTAKKIEDAVKSGKLAKDHTIKVGDLEALGIRSIFENIHSPQVFQVNYQKQDEVLPAKELNALRDAQISKSLEIIEKASKGKTGVTKAATEELKKIQENPITGTKAGEMRTLTGYKVQFTSRDGRYSCVDMNITSGVNTRPVNINTLQWIIIGGVKYIVK